MQDDATKTPDLATRLGALVVFVVAMLSLRGQFDASQAAMRAPAPAVLWALAGYFTVLTNTLVAGIMVAVAMKARLPPAVGLTMVLAIVMVGAVYHTLLAGLNDPQGAAWWADQGLHTAVPILTLVWWLAYAPHPDRLWPALIWPLAYAVYALGRGAVTGWYPYPFLDAAALGWGRVALNCAGMVLAFATVGTALIATKRQLDRPS